MTSWRHMLEHEEGKRMFCSTFLNRNMTQVYVRPLNISRVKDCEFRTLVGSVMLDLNCFGHASFVMTSHGLSLCSIFVGEVSNHKVSEAPTRRLFVPQLYNIFHEREPNIIITWSTLIFLNTSPDVNYWFLQGRKSVSGAHHCCMPQIFFIDFKQKNHRFINAGSLFYY